MRRRRSLRDDLGASRATITALLALLLPGVALADDSQGPLRLDPSRPGSHELALRTMSGAENQAFDALLAQYDAYLAQRPDDVSAQIERCRFLAGASCDEDEDCPHWDEYERCTDALEERFAGDPGVELFRLERIWGKQAIESGTSLLDGVARSWREKDVARIHEKLAQSYDADRQAELVLEHARRAMEFDSSIDVTLIAARALQRLGQRDAAVRMLLSRPMRPEQYVVELQKIRMLADLGAFSDAELELRLLGEPPDGEADPLLEARVYSEVGRVADARSALAHAQRESSAQWQWRARAIAQQRFDLELASGDPDAVLAAYDALREQGGWDLFLRDRVRVAVRHPDAAWRRRDTLALLGNLALLAAIACVPGLLLLPVHYIGLVRARRHPDRVPRATRFGLRHVWWVLALLLLAQLPIFYMEGVHWLDDIFDGKVSRISQQAPVPDRSLALALAIGVGLTLVGLLPILRPRDLALFGRRSWTWRRTIGVAIACVVLLRVAAIAWAALFPDLSSYTMPAAVLPKHQPYTWQMLTATGRSYGLPALGIAMVFVIPLYEEIAFRGVLLQGLSRYLPAGTANFLQASLFAGLHEQLGFFPILFALGLAAGSMARRSGSLVGPLLLHAGNNAVAFFTLARVFGASR